MKRILTALSFATIINFTPIDLMAQTTTKSRTGKNALIGAGAGAVTGAVVSKKHRAKGAVIGGAIGAAGGYAWGKHKDKKKGRRIVTKHS